MAPANSETRKHKFNASAWVDAVEAIQGVDIYVAKVEGKDNAVWSGFRIWTGHSEDAATDEGRLRYHDLMAGLKAAPAASRLSRPNYGAAAA